MEYVAVVQEKEELRYMPLPFMPTVSLPHNCSSQNYYREVVCSDIELGFIESKTY